ncbi:FUSC family protein [Diaphorobacter sp. HDW4A]|uniref:FUSC family protein n=1 Tax=Diaphorobacter sp. HDW4A TaxID=2714924 RepID=UPI00140D57B9|nr:FUSC family protein [Diaphorobacter sp. HDW4A]QIL78796.1 FUSC family protein [Diaphorobacter sp. HDW4A]
MTNPERSVASHGRMLVQMLAPARLRESLSLNRPPSVRNATVAGMQATIAVVIAAIALHLSPWPHMAGFAALGGMAALFGRFASPSKRRSMVFTAGCMLTAPVAVLSSFALLGITPVGMLLLLSVVAGLLAAVAHRTQIGAPGAVIFVFAASAAISPISTGAEWAERVLATGAGALIATIICALTDHLRDLDVRLPPPPSVAMSAPLSATPPFSPGYAPQFAIRVAICAAISSLIAYAMDWSHPAWASIGAIAILQGVHLPGTIHRAWQRTLGTIVGAFIAWVILSAHPSFWQILLVVAIFQFVTEIIIGYNYALGQIAITPMALLMTALSGHSGATDMAVSRIYDTALGALVGIVFALVLSSLDERMHLARHHSRKA